MDLEQLKREGYAPCAPFRAHLPGYELCIGRRAGLMPKDAASAFGMVATLSCSELTELYSGPGLDTYYPLQVVVRDLDTNQSAEVLCYNVSEEDIGERVDSIYAKQLAQIVRKLGFPTEYAQAIVGNAGGNLD